MLCNSIIPVTSLYDVSIVDVHAPIVSKILKMFTTVAGHSSSHVLRGHLNPTGMVNTDCDKT